MSGIKERERWFEEADALSSLDNPAPLGGFAKDLSVRVIKGELTAEEATKLIIESHRQ